MKIKNLLFIGVFLWGGLASANAFETDTIKTKTDDTLIITFIKHSSLMLQFNDQYIQIDPVSDYANYAEFPKADMIIVTHEHGDHYDPKAIAALEKEGTIIITNRSTAEKLGKGIVMENGDKKQPTEYMTLEAVPAYNITAGREMYHPRHRDNGFVINIGGLRIYISGDTEDIPEMAQLKHIDIAFLPVNQPYTMTVDQAIHALSMFSPKVFYPYHYGDTDVKLFVDKLKNSKIELRIRQMQ